MVEKQTQMEERHLLAADLDHRPVAHSLTFPQLLLPDIHRGRILAAFEEFT
jgi:hypothetical protein